MRRKSMHLVFGVLALGCAGVAVSQGIRLIHARTLDAQIAQVLSGHTPAGATHDGEARPVRLARAVMLAKAGNEVQAANLYDALVAASPDLSDPVARAALFDAAGMSLREGSVDGRAVELRSLPVIADAKTRYRTLLRATPDDWDARYNLERALRLAPELPDGPLAGRTAPDRRMRLVGAESQDLP
jgi:mxaK protein